MESNQNTNAPKSKQTSLDREATMKLLESIGAKYVQKQGAILMPLSKKQREAMMKSKDNKDE